jgi:hypothetical protein
MFRLGQQSVKLIKFRIVLLRKFQISTIKQFNDFCKLKIDATIPGIAWSGTSNALNARK